ncbi:MAG TPA: hypothetical protein DEB73_02680 [Candidatus Magasanikbacteria bacterium]|uniref:Uncharacterized protein n=2 Tax=Candidatus Magasanikiibacteriota TaxID=1752731 RepID=A0A0G0ZYQ3_9BACT|nr:MAG: hypothetical protein UU49_C0014G0005 [Candidatus Magasanikbacteria bacterium GW2011_GWC2_41_17]KKS53822.1 MAG: hypothetical protein UV20_C0045G0003 [Candidatus Magasanikbacteria bacterium GW2011_GWA2_42_32]HBV58138.1 hypothetical protein [Candidatus Magasanikbacteria bacterium]HBX15945.1 hypothetical protein [Candidatus Magasanikbacteria bacterium]
METRKIAVACFIGGVLCCTVALLFAPAYWWLGLLSGIAAGVTSGYISYDFREILKAVPVALRAAERRGSSAVNFVEEWLHKPHPFIYLSLFISVVFFSWLMTGKDSFTNHVDPRTGMGIGYELDYMTILLMSIVVFEITGMLVIPYIVASGTVADYCYWSPSPYGDNGLMLWRMSKPRREGDKPAQLTYANVARWFVMGLGVIVLFFIWTIWKYIAIGFWLTLCFFSRFVWHLFKLIHSEKRVLCAIDGTLGGVASYIWLASSATTFAEQTALVIFGGFLGAAFGVANWEIISKRIFHIDAPVNSASA